MHEAFERVIAENRERYQHDRRTYADYVTSREPDIARRNAQFLGEIVAVESENALDAMTLIFSDGRRLHIYDSECEWIEPGDPKWAS